MMELNMQAETKTIKEKQDRINRINKISMVSFSQID
jgi:hypothetical protein